MQFIKIETGTFLVFSQARIDELKSVKPRKSRILQGKRSYPKWHPRMTTAEYIFMYNNQENQLFKPFLLTCKNIDKAPAQEIPGLDAFEIVD